jgi:hypothetical protein
VLPWHVARTAELDPQFPSIETDPVLVDEGDDVLDVDVAEDDEDEVSDPQVPNPLWQPAPQ